VHLACADVEMMQRRFIMYCRVALQVTSCEQSYHITSLVFSSISAYNKSLRSKFWRFTFSTALLQRSPSASAGACLVHKMRVLHLLSADVAVRIVQLACNSSSGNMISCVNADHRA
jgi:hypothetical protein